MCKNKLNLFDLYNKTIFWGQIDSMYLKDRINSLLEEDINFIEINLEKIKSFDESYIQDVFIDTSLSTKKLGRELIYIFSNPDYEELIFQLSNIFLSNKIFSILKSKNKIEIIGDASYLKKVIFKNISENDVINPVTICQEFDKPLKSCEIEFDEFVNIGFLEKETDEKYRTNLSFV